MLIDLPKILGASGQPLAADIQPAVVELATQVDAILTQVNAEATARESQLQSIGDELLAKVTALVKSIPLLQSSEMDIDLMLAGTVPLKGTVALKPPRASQ